MISRRNRLTLQGRRSLDAKSHATPSVWSDVAFACGACHVCLGGARGATWTCQPGDRRTGISSRGAKHGRGGGTGRAGRAPGLDKASRSRETGAAVGRTRRTALDGQPRGTTLADQDGATRTIGSGFLERGSESANGDARARCEEQAPRQEARPRTREAPPREPERHNATASSKGQRGQLCGQMVEGLSKGHGRSPGPIAPNSCERDMGHA